MGCDIHPFVQYKIHHTDDALIGTEIWFARDYHLFGLMAGVRGEGPPLVAERGLPEKRAYEIDELMRQEFYHTSSWLTLEEVTAVRERLSYPSPDLDLVVTMMQLLQEQERDPVLVFWFDN